MLGMPDGRAILPNSTRCASSCLCAKSYDYSPSAIPPKLPGEAHEPILGRPDRRILAPGVTRWDCASGAWSHLFCGHRDGGCVLGASPRCGGLSRARAWGQARASRRCVPPGQLAPAATPPQSEPGQNPQRTWPARVPAPAARPGRRMIRSQARMSAGPANHPRQVARASVDSTARPGAGAASTGRGCSHSKPRHTHTSGSTGTPAPPPAGGTRRPPGRSPGRPAQAHTPLRARSRQSPARYRARRCRARESWRSGAGRGLTAAKCRAGSARPARSPLPPPRAVHPATRTATAPSSAPARRDRARACEAVIAPSWHGSGGIPLTHPGPGRFPPGVRRRSASSAWCWPPQPRSPGPGLGSSSGAPAPAGLGCAVRWPRSLRRTGVGQRDHAGVAQPARARFRRPDGSRGSDRTNRTTSRIERRAEYCPSTDRPETDGRRSA